MVAAPNPESRTPKPGAMTTSPKPESRAPSPGTLPLLIEIGCEEIPARFLAGAQKEFGERLQEGLREAALLAGAVGEPRLQTYSTPRRLVAYVPDVLGKQHDRVEEVRGPAVKAAFDAQGKPTRAAESFAAKNGAAVRNLIKVSTPKGEYVALQKRIPGRPALEVLPEILPPVITGLSFPKSMYWEKSKTRFVRPIRWLLVLLGCGQGSRIIPFEVAGVQSSNRTYGSRVLGSESVTVNSFEDYSRKLRQAGVEFDPENRRQSVQGEIDRLLERDFEVVPDLELESWIVNSTEWTSGIRGGFHERFLHLPREILITVMRDHQKYFAVQDHQGKLQPEFITLLNWDYEGGLIRGGHERVLAARFADAEFFWNADQKVPLRDRLPMLERVTYQVRLGSYADKVRRMEHIAGRLCADVEGQGRLSPGEAHHAFRAVQLCKCDLTTQMVQEFTELQGVVGGLYAKAQGEPEAVWQAIYDHYLPLSADGQSPRSIHGAVVSLADKLDSVIAGFSAGLEPTGSSDPFALRRAGNGIIKISVELLPSLDLLELLKQASLAIQDKLALGVPSLQLSQQAAGANFGPSPEVPQQADVSDQVAAFLRERAESYMETVAGLRYDTVRAVIQAKSGGWERPADALARGRALERIRDGEDFVALSTAAKRTRNILSKSAKPDDLTGTIDPIDEELLAAGPEEDLYRAYSRLRPTLDGLASRDEYEEAFRVLAGLRSQVDAFFDKVLVMDDDIRVRRNRLNLLSKVNLWVFQRFADLSQIESRT